MTASASSGVGVASVQFQLDGANLGAAVTSSPYSVSWNTITASNASHTLTAIATDTAGNKTTSTAVTVTVSNAAGPVGFWTFDTSGISGNTFLDSSGNGNNAVCTAVTSVAGVVNQAGAFNGTSSSCSVSTDTSMLLANNVSLYVWVHTTNASRYESLISTYNASGSESNYLLRTTPSGTLSLKIGGTNMTGGNSFEALDSRKINDGKWHQVAAVLQIGTGVTFYVDGVAAPLVAANIVARASAFLLTFGTTSWTPYGNDFTGDMDQLRIYNRALAASEVAGLYSADGGGTVPAPPTVSLTAPANNATVSGTVTVSANASAGLGVANVQFQLDGASLGSPVAASPYSVSWNTTSIYNGTHTLTAVVTDTGGNTATSAAVTVTVNNSGGSGPTIPAGAVGYWSFDTSDVSGNTYLDLSGNGATAVCTAVTSVTGVVNQAAAFNGKSSNCTVSADTSMLLTGSLSLSLWVHTTNSSRYEALLSTYDASGSEYNYLLRTTSAGVIDLRIGGHSMSTGGSFDAVDSRKINDGNWHHVAAVIQIGMGVTIYIDGVASSLFPANIVAGAYATPLNSASTPGPRTAITSPETWMRRGSTILRSRPRKWPLWRNSSRRRIADVADRQISIEAQRRGTMIYSVTTMRSILFAGLVVSALASGPLRGQVLAAISGNVEDVSGAPVAGAAVTVQNLETGAARVLVTDALGNYHVPSVPLGPQSVKIEKPGFKTVLRTGIRLETGQEAVVDITLEPRTSRSTAAASMT